MIRQQVLLDDISCLCHFAFEEVIVLTEVCDASTSENYPLFWVMDDALYVSRSL